MMEVDWLKRQAQLKPFNKALTDGETGESLSYEELYRWALATAQYLKINFQINKGDRIACLAQNSLEYVVLFFALQRLGAILVPLNFRLAPRELEYIISDCKAHGLFVDETYAETVKTFQAPPKVFKLEELRKYKNSHSTDFAGDFNDTLMILYTSGTTGFPKGAVLTHQMLFWNSINTALSLNLTEKDCAITFLPFFHTGGWNVLTTPFLHHGAHIVLLKKFDAGQVLSLSTRYRATLLFGVPTTMEMMARTPHFNEMDLAWIRYAIVGGEPMPVPLIEKWHQKQIFIRQGYGLTEFGPNVFSLHQKDAVRKQGSIGFPNFYVQARVVNSDGKTLGANEVGELILSGPMMMKEYWNNPTATAETIRNGWLHTGDLVRMDEDGYFYVVGRKKDMFISGGENVYPVEVEQVIAQLPGVREVAVIGVPDNKWGEVGCAYVVSDGDLDADQVLHHTQKNLAKFKVPKSVQFLSSLPKGDSGKILKKALKEHFSANYFS